jgi:hypothetical protein
MDLVPAGKYRSRAIEAVLGETGTGKEQVVVRFEILNEGFDGHTVPWYAVFATDKMSRRILEGLRACGWDGDDLSDLSGVSDNDVEIEVEHHEWNGRVNARVKWVNKLGGPIVTPIPPERARAFAARMKQLAAQIPTPGLKAEPTSRTPPGFEASNDEVPF